MSTQEVQAALSIEISDIQYWIPGAVVFLTPPNFGPIRSVTNDSATGRVETIDYTYTKSVGTWNNADGTKPAERSTFTAGVPNVTNAKLQLSVSEPSLHTFGGDEGVYETVHATSTVTVPPRKRATVNIRERTAMIRSVPFTYRQIIRKNGRIEDSVKNGVYANQCEVGDMPHTARTREEKDTRLLDSTRRIVPTQRFIVPSPGDRAPSTHPHDPIPKAQCRLLIDKCLD